MEVQCHQVTRRYIYTQRGASTHNFIFELTVIVNGQVIPINLARDIRPYLGSLSQLRQDALIATMPPRIEVIRTMKYGQPQYRLATIDAKYWAEQALAYLDKRQSNIRRL